MGPIEAEGGRTHASILMAERYGRRMIQEVAGLNHYRLSYEPSDSGVPIPKTLPPLPRLDHYALRCKSCGNAISVESPNEPHPERIVHGGHVVLRDKCPVM